MFLFLVIAGSLFILISLVGISLSLQDLDQRLMKLSKVMDDRFGAWNSRSTDRGAESPGASASGKKPGLTRNTGKV